MNRRRRNKEDDLDRELRCDLDLETEEQREKGLPPDEARHAAQRAFGNTTSIKQEVREMWTGALFDTLIQDMRYVLRTLRKSPGYAATAILTLALGIGASTAVFTVVDSVILKPLSYRDSGSLVVAWERVPFATGAVGPNPRHVDIWRKRSTAFAGLTLLRQSANGLTLGLEHPRLAGTVTCLPNLFDVLQVNPLLGRTFLPEESIQGRDNVAILTYPLWQSLFHGDPNVIGKTLRLADTPRVIVGVLPAGFHFPNANSLRAFGPRQSASSVPEPSVFVPAAIDLAQVSWNGEYGNWVALGRLKPGVSIGEAETQLKSLATQIVREIPVNQRSNNPDALSASVQPMQEAVVGESRTGLWLLMGAVLGLVLIACLNLANAQLGRALSRHREAAVRLALGAAKWRLLWNALAENLLLAIAGGLAGILLAAAGIDAFRRYSPIDIPRLSEIHLNFTVLLFSAALAFTASVLSGLLPALRLLRADPQASLQRTGSRTLGSRQSGRVRAWLVGLEVFGCTALLLLTGLFSKSLLHLLRQDKGFETAHVAVAEVRLPPKTYGTDLSRISFDDAVLRNLRAIGGVETAGLVSAMPLEGESWIEGAERADRPNRQESILNLRWVSPGYFETMREKLIAGRFFEERDRNLHSAVLAEGVAKALWPGESAVGGQLRIEGRTFTVIGVAADSRNTSVKLPPVRMAWVYFNDRAPYTAVFVARGAQSADTLVANMRQAIWNYAPDITLARVKTMDSQLAASLSTERFQTLVLVAFGISALLLAMLGIYGVLSYSVVTRKQEIGVRMALGASRRTIYALTLGEAGAPVLVGLAAGLIASILAGRLIRNLLYGAQVVDLSVMLMVAALFLAAALSAAFLPARRAASIDPMDTLRSE